MCLVLYTLLPKQLAFFDIHALTLYCIPLFVMSHLPCHVIVYDVIFFLLNGCSMFLSHLLFRSVLASISLLHCHYTKLSRLFARFTVACQIVCSLFASRLSAESLNANVAVWLM